MTEQKVWTVEERTNVGIALIKDVDNGTFKFARELVSGQGDVEIRMAIYWALNDKHIDVTDELAAAALLFTAGIDRQLAELKVKCRAHFARGLLDTMSPDHIENLARLMFSHDYEPVGGHELTMHKRRREEAERTKAAAQVRSSFNAQHKPAPEGTVKELAAKYNKSLSKIRRLKAAGELHTLESENV